MLRVHLYNEYEGQVVLDDVDPEGLDSLEIELKRSSEYEGILREISLPLRFFKKGRNFIKKVYDSFGVDGKILMNVYQYDPDKYLWESVGVWSIDFKIYDLDPIGVRVSIQTSGFDNDFINQIEKDVDLETIKAFNGQSISSTPVFDLKLHSKSILKTLEATPINSEADWNNDTVYALNDKVKYKLPNETKYKTYKSLQNVNQGHQPNISLTFWELVSSVTIPYQDLSITFTLPQSAFLISVTREFTFYGGIDFGNVISGDLKNNFQTPFGFSPTNINPQLITLESGIIDIDISISLKHTIDASYSGGSWSVTSPCSSPIIGQRTVRTRLRHTDASDVIISDIQIGTDLYITGCGAIGGHLEGVFDIKTYSIQNVNVSAGDKFYVYYTFYIYGVYSGTSLTGDIVTYGITVQADVDNTWIRFVQKTSYPETITKAIMIYEAMDKMAKYYSGNNVAFASTLLGRTDLIDPSTKANYLSDGKYSLIAITNGKNIRGSNNKTIFGNWKDAILSINAITPIGYGFETIADGTRIMRVESKDFFYKRNIVSLDLGEVSNIKTTVDFKRYFNTFEIGYPKIENINQVNGMDEFNEGVRRYTFPISQVSGKKTVVSKYRASGYETENQRRLQGLTKESRLDDENFFICLRRYLGGYVTEKNETFIIIRNVYDPLTIYNVRISIGRNLQNWITWLAPIVTKKTNKTMSFSYGDGNYNIESQVIGEETIVERNDVDLKKVVLPYEFESYHLESKLTRAQFKTLKENPYGLIAFKDDDGIQRAGYLDQLNYKPEQNQATIILLKTL